MDRHHNAINTICVKETGQFDGPKNYEYFGGLVKKEYVFD